jgi:hypothetical protein
MNANQTACTACPSGWSTAAAGATSQSECKLSCPAGQYLPKNTESCRTCPAGRFCAGVNDASKSTNDDQGNTSHCPIGYYCPAGTTEAAKSSHKCPDINYDSFNAATTTTITNENGVDYGGGNVTDCHPAADGAKSGTISGFILRSKCNKTGGTTEGFYATSATAYPRDQAGINKFCQATGNMKYCGGCNCTDADGCKPACRTEACALSCIAPHNNVDISFTLDTIPSYKY